MRIVLTVAINYDIDGVSPGNDEVKKKFIDTVSDAMPTMIIVEDDYAIMFSSTEVSGKVIS